MQTRMKLHLFLAAAAILAAPAFAAQDPTVVTYAQRRALLAADVGCGLLAPEPRAALTAMTAQARSTLVRAGWTRAQLADLESKAIAAGRRHACASPALTTAAASARAGYQGWRKLGAMAFPGSAAGWTSRRTPDPNGWLVFQDLPDGGGARFGIRQGVAGPELAFTAPDAARANGARIRLRDAARAPQPGFDAPGRAAARLTDRLPMAVESRAILAAERRAEVFGKTTATLFVFAPTSLQALTALDPREAIGLELPMADGAMRLYVVEVGDLAAAYAFAALR